jgi:hypothetical protein
MTPDNLRDVLAEALHPILEAVRAETLRAAAHALSQGLQYDGPQSVMFLQDLANRHASADWPVRIESGEPERQADALAPTVKRLIADARAEGEGCGIQYAIGTMHGVRPVTRDPNEREQRVLDLLRARRDGGDDRG